MARYRDAVPDLERRRSPHFDYLDLRQSPPASIIAPSYGHTSVDYRDNNHSTIVRPSHNHGHSHQHHSPTVIEEPVVEHEHHHVHHHIDHGDITGQSLALNRAAQHAQSHLTRKYSYEDIEVDDMIQYAHDNEQPRHRRRRRHRSRRGSRTRISQSEIDITGISVGHQSDHDDVTVVDVPVGTRRIYVNVDKSQPHQFYSERDSGVNWRREHGIRRSRGLGNELWTEITKDLVTREAIEDLEYPYEETEYFYYIFEYLDRGQIAELRDLTNDIRHERVRDIEYMSISGSQSAPRISQGVGDFDDNRTEIIINTRSHSGSRDRSKRRYYY